MDLPAKFLTNLYLISLGEEYSTLEAVVSVLPAEQQTLVEVMRRAADHTIVEKDEADNSAHALIAKLEREGYVMQKKQKTAGAFAATGHSNGRGCSVCGKNGHTKDECFALGGGLHHLTPPQRYAHILKRRTQREQRWAQQQGADESKSNNKQKKDNDAEVAALVQDVEKKEQMYSTLKGQIQEMLPGYDFSSIEK